MTLETHYSVLGISRSASAEEIKAAYRAILLANHPDKTQHLAPFARVLAERRVRAAHIAHEVLLDPERAAKYDAEVRIWDSFDSGDTWGRPRDGTSFGTPEPERGFPSHHSRPRSSNDAEEYDFADVEEDDTSPGSAGVYTSPFPSSTNQASSYHPQAGYRYGLTRTATNINIKLKAWSLYLLLSTKFRFLNTVTALPTGCDTRTIAFELHLERNKSYRPIGTESSARRNPELIIGVEYIPNGARGVGDVQTIFKEVAKDFLTLSICITSTPFDVNPSTIPPWMFSFDFDMNGHPAAWGRKRGTCMVFTRDRQSVAETPEDVLKRDVELTARYLGGYVSF